MIKRNILVVLSGLCLMLFVAAANADENQQALSSMANIMLHLNHYPSDTEKQQLQKFTSDMSLSGNVRTMAAALTNLEHTAKDEDKEKLSAIMKDANASESEKTLASVIYSVNHKPSDADKEKLSKIAK